MQLTKESEYALSGLAFLAIQPVGTTVALSEVAVAQGLPPHFLAKIFQKLARARLVSSQPGPGKGFTLGKPPADITVLEILEAVEGRRVLDGCLLWAGHCGEDDPCPLHYRLKSLVPAVEAELMSISLESFAAHSPKILESG